jgi:hypothetical protein
MTKEKLIDMLLDACTRNDQIESAGRIDNEDAIGVELTDGEQYFISIEPA